MNSAPGLAVDDPPALARPSKVLQAAYALVVRRPVVTPLVVATIVRVVAAVGITIFQRYLFPDEAQYVALGRLAAAGRLTPRYQSGYGETLFHEAASFMWPITILFKLFGPHVLVAALWAATFGVVAAAFTALLVGRVLGRGWGALAGLIVAVFPSQVLWSSVVLRESMVWAALAGVALGIAGFSRAQHWRGLAGATVLTGASLLTVAYLRSWAFLAAAWAAAFAVWLFRPTRAALARGLCALLCLLIPVISGLGPAGSSYLFNRAHILGYERTVLSEGAKSAFVHPKAVAVPTTTSGPTTSGPTTSGPTTSGPTTSGPTTSGPTTSGPTTVAPAPTTTVVTMPSALANESLVVPTGFRNDLKALPAGLVAFALRPFPWQHGAGLSYDFAAVEELLYYPLYLLAMVGVVAYRQRREVIAFPVAVIVLVTGIASEAEGNLGSAFRHRDQLFWAIAFLAVLGIHHIYTTWRGRRTTTALSVPNPDAPRLPANAEL